MIHILTNTYRVIDPWFGGPRRPIELDMGCGKGGFLLALAERRPDRLVLGSDVMLGRLRRVARKIERRGLCNVELLRAENFELAAFQLPDGCIQRVHILCPDPWPKGRHRARRLITSEFLGRLARLLAPGGVVHLATDHEPYLRTFRVVLGADRRFRPDPGGVADVADIRSDFEKQWLAEGRRVPHLAFRFSPESAVRSRIPDAPVPALAPGPGERRE